MNELQVFESEKFGKVRMTLIDNEPWFVAADVCKALDMTNPTMALGRLDEDEKMTLNSTEGHSGNRGGAQSINVVNEPGLYSLVLGSRKPEAKAFKRWITHDVIPTIRKHGAYMTPETLYKCMSTPEALIQMLTALKDEQGKRAAAELKVEVLDAENALLTQQALEWDKRSFVLAAVRRLSMAMPSKWPDVRFKQAWNRYRQELLYNHSINLNARIHNIRATSSHPSMVKATDAMDDSIIDTCVSTITAMCREESIDIEDLLKNIPA